MKYRNKKSEHRNVMHYYTEIHDKAEPASFISGFDEKELLKLIKSLTPAYRKAFNLFVMEGMKHKEIAELLGIAEGTSKSNLADAREILRKKVIALERTYAS